MKEYMEKYRSRIVLMGLFVFLIHGAKLNSEIIGIDTEDLIQYQGDFYDGWLNTGRQGLVLLKQMMGNLSFNPYFSGLLTVLCFAVAVSAFFMLWDAVGGKRRHSAAAWIAGGLLLISHPVITEQFYFTLQSAEICIGIFLTAIALYLTYYWERTIFRTGKCRLDKHILLPCGSILLLLVTFSVYQVFVVIYIFGVVTLLLLEGLSEVLENAEPEAGKMLARIVPYVFVFLAAFLFNSIITEQFFQTSDYLSNQIQWGENGILRNLGNIGAHIMKTMSGYGGIYYNPGYGILCLVTVVTMILLLICLKQKKPVVFVMLFYLAALLSTPYLMTIVLGAAPACRSQLVLPMATGFLAYLVIEMWLALGVNRNKGGSYAGYVLLGGIVAGCIIGIFQQTMTTFRLYYTDRMRYEQDAAMGRELITRIEQLCAEDEVAFVVVGNKPFEGNNICVEGEMIGVSFFDHDSEVEPPCYWSTKRVQGLLHVLGANYEIAPVERFEGAIEFSEDMPEWPAEDSVRLFEGVTIVKLSD